MLTQWVVLYPSYIAYPTPLIGASRSWPSFTAWKVLCFRQGFSVATEQGVSDEGEPWFVFCRADNEEVIAHFARIDGEYVIVSNFLGIRSGAVIFVA